MLMHIRPDHLDNLTCSFPVTIPSKLPSIDTHSTAHTFYNLCETQQQQQQVKLAIDPSSFVPFLGSYFQGSSWINNSLAV